MLLCPGLYLKDWTQVAVVIVEVVLIVVVVIFVGVMIIVVVVVEVFLQDQINRREQRSNDSHTGISGNGFSVENESGFSYLVPYSRAHSHVIILKKKSSWE